MLLVLGLPSIDMRTILHTYRCDDLNKALTEDLPFKIPTTDPTAQHYPNYFEYRTSNIDCYVSSFLKYCTIGESETTAVILDGDWLRIVDSCLNLVSITMNQYDKSSVAMKRPDATVQVCGAVALKQEAKHLIADLVTAFKELTDKLHVDAIKVFPQGNYSIVGVTSCVGRIQLAFITFDSTARRYSATLIKEYKVQQLPDRVSFLVDLMKVCRWMASITGSHENFHLIPDVRRPTDNNHHITWTVEGIYKEFDHDKDMSQAVAYIRQVYTHDPKLLHVEYGEVKDNKSIMITRIGNRLTLANMNKLSLTRDMVIGQVRLGLDELHGIGLAHCDVKVSNVFIDSYGIVFLDDLEYLTPVNDPAPNFNYLPAGTTNDQVQNARQLDEYQFQLFTAEVNRM